MKLNWYQATDFLITHVIYIHCEYASSKGTITTFQNFTTLKAIADYLFISVLQSWSSLVVCNISLPTVPILLSSLLEKKI